MRGFEVVFVPSRWQKMGALLGYLTIMCCVLWYFDVAMRALLSVGSLLAVVCAWREPSVRIVKMRVDAYGRTYLFFPQRRKPQLAQLQTGSVVGLYACFLKWRLDNGRIIWQAVLPDALSREDFRLLRVWARFGQSKKT